MPRRISIKNKLNQIDAVILCGGRGTRLRKTIKGIPKPMAKIGDRPFLEILIDYLSSFGIRRFILATGYRSNVISDFFRKNRKKGLKILVCSENKPLGTGGALKNAKRLIHSDPFIVLNGDSFARLNPFDLLIFHRNNRALISMVITKSRKSQDSGIVEISKDAKIIGFLEKPESSRAGYNNCGVYVCGRKVFNTFPLSKKFSLERDYFPKIVNKRLYGYVINDSFMDIGTPERYKKANKVLAGHWNNCNKAD